jgi:hypothetical protein
MSESLAPEQVAILIRARQIQRDKGLSADIDIAGICQAAGISRKTGYQWAERHTSGAAQRQGDLEEQLARLQAEHDKLNRDFDQVSFENRGRKLAWKIHRVDELLAAKKTRMRQGKRGSGKVFEERIPAAAHGILGAEAVLWHSDWLGQGF